MKPTIEIILTHEECATIVRSLSDSAARLEALAEDRCWHSEIRLALASVAAEYRTLGQAFAASCGPARAAMPYGGGNNGHGE